MAKIKKALLILFYITNVGIIVCTLISAFGGYFPPNVLKGIPGIAALTFPLWLIVVPIMTLFSFFWSKKMMTANIVTIIVCINSFLTFCPLNFIKPTPPEKSVEIKVMSYNVLHYNPYKEDFFPTDYSVTINTIIHSGADIVCIQEGVLPHKLNNRKTYATDEQIDSLYTIYPYQYSNDEGLSTFSKYPVTMRRTKQIPGSIGSLQIYDYDINGCKLTIYDTHLQSFGLNPNDKDLYINLTKGNADNNIRRSKNQLFDKLRLAFEYHAAQAHAIRELLDGEKGKNIIVCGDFNDIPGCYAIRKICGDNLYDSFRRSGVGPAITYRDNRFYFHIDHMLCSESITTTSIHPIHEGASDHFPIIATLHLSK